jgi:putative FmdB family regulatory protein
MLGRDSGRGVMPLYEYLCGGCSLRFERLVMGAEIPSCPSCGSTRLARQVSRFAVGGRSESGGDSEAADADLSDAGDPAGACGSCGDPRGPGACDLDD